MPTLDKLQSADFSAHLHETFRIPLDGEADAVSLELARVTESAGGSGLEARRSFSLLFLGPVSRQYFVQRTYRLEHEQMGALEIFLVPLGPVEGRMQYEAIFT
jgi:hypothetical protein